MSIILGVPSYPKSPPLCIKEDPIALGKIWRKRVLSRFWTSVVFPIFDIGGLAFWDNLPAQKAWKDRFGQAGLMGDFRIHRLDGSLPSWWKFQESVEEGSMLYVHRSEKLMESLVQRLPPENSYVIEDALEYHWLPERWLDFRRGWDREMRAFG